MRRTFQIVMVIAMVSVIFVSARAATEKSTDGEKAAITALGMGERYNELFAPNGFVVAAFLLPGDPNIKDKRSVSITRFYEPNTHKPLGYKWIARDTNAPQSKLSRSEFLKQCGKPDAESPGLITYGRVTLSFGGDDLLSEVTILTKE